MRQPPVSERMPVMKGINMSTVMSSPAALLDNDGRLCERADESDGYFGAVKAPPEVHPHPPHFSDKVVGQSGAMREMLRQVSIVAPMNSTVLLLGETGTGKELIARAIHNLSSRRNGPYIK